MKPIKPAVCAAILLTCLTGCSAKETDAYKDETIISAEAVSEAVPAAPKTVILNGKEFTLPSEEFIDSAFKDNNGEYNILYFPDGIYKSYTSEELDNLLLAEYLYGMMDEEYFNKHEKDNYESYEDFIADMQLYYGIDDDHSPLESSLLISINCSYYNEGEAPVLDAYGKAAFNYIVKKISANAFPEISEIIASGKGHTLNIYVEAEDDKLKISAYFHRDNSTESPDLIKDKFISLDGSELVSIGSAGVSPDTKSLYITSEKDAENAEDWSGVSPEGYDSVIYNCLDDIDISALAQNLPNLERLFIDVYSVQCKNPHGFAEFSNLSELDFEYPDNCEESSWISEIKADRLTIRDISKSIDELSECKADTIIINCSTDDWVLDSISDCDNIDELTLRSRFVPDNPDFSIMTGIKNLKKLTLDITADDDPLDLSAFEGADFFEELEINTDREITAEILPTIKNLRSLTLKNINNNDYSFFKDMTSLESITFDDCNVDYDDFTDIYSLQNITQLNLKDVYVDFNGIETLSKLNTLLIKDCYYRNFTDIIKISSLKFLDIENSSGNSFDAEQLENFTQLEKLRIKDIELRHYNSLKNLDNLKQLELISVGLTEEQANSLRKALPHCEIITEGFADSEDVIRAEPETSEMYGDIRVESYKSPADYWNKNYVLKNVGDDTVENVLDFLTENGFLEGAADMIISYPYENSTVQEIIQIKDGAPDYDTSEVYISVLSTIDPDILEKYEFRQLDPNETVSLYLSDKK